MMTNIKNYPQLKEIRDLAKKRKVSVFLVGGFLRDKLIGRDGLDFDFAVERDALKLAKSFSKKIKGAYVELDKERGCARVVHRIRNSNSVRSRQKSKISSGPKKAQYEVAIFDFADFRAKTIRGDLARRDFTINTLSIDLLKADLNTDFNDMTLDTKSGFKDIKAKRIKMVSSEAFKEDPLRMLRAFSLQALLDFKIDQTTLAQIKKNKKLLHSVSPERIREEFLKILTTQNAYKNLVQMDKIGFLEEVIPQITVMFKCAQGGYHHLDVWKHTLEAVKQMERVFDEVNDAEINAYLDEKIGGDHPRRALMKFAMLLHDIGKPDTKQKDGKKFHFYGHERVGKDITRHIAHMLKFSTKQRYLVQDLVLWHLRPGYLSNFKKPSERMIFRFLRDAKTEAVSILLLSLADQRATRGPLTSTADQKHHEKIALSLVKRYFDKLKEKPFVRLLDGDDVLKALKLKPSPLVGKILREIEEAQVLGKVTTKKEALALARKIKK